MPIYTIEIDYPASFDYPSYWGLVNVQTSTIEKALEFCLSHWDPMVPLVYHTDLYEVPGEMIDTYILGYFRGAYYVKRWHRDDLEGPFVW